MSLVRFNPSVSVSPNVRNGEGWNNYEKNGNRKPKRSVKDTRGSVYDGPLDDSDEDSDEILPGQKFDDAQNYLEGNY